MQQLSLFENGSFVIPVLSNDIPHMLEENVPVSRAIESATLTPATPPYREWDWMLKQAEGIPCSVAILKASRYKIRSLFGKIYRLQAVKVVPLDVEASLVLQHYKNGFNKSWRRSTHIDAAILSDSSSHLYTPNDLNSVECCCVLKPMQEDDSCPLPNGKDDRIYFPVDNLLAQNPDDSFLMQHLQRQGLNVILSPSLRGWLRREWLRREIDATPFLLPEVNDTRPLFERAEVGLTLRCTKPVYDFIAGSTYVVVGAAVNETTEDGTTQEVVTLVPITSRNAVPLKWPFYYGDMEDYFELVDKDQVIYDPPQCLPNKFPHLFHQAQRRLEKLNLPLFKHTAYDAAQISVKDHAFLGKPMRMGKSREAIAAALLWGSQRIGIVSPGIARMDMWAELNKLNRQHEARLVKTVDDLRDGSRFYLMTLPWLKHSTDPLKGRKYRFPVKAHCPHCGQTLHRKPKGTRLAAWTTDYGYRCTNLNCSYRQVTRRKHHGRRNKHYDPVAWGGYVNLQESAAIKNDKGQTISGGYVDYERAKHIERCVLPILRQYFQKSEEEKFLAGLFHGRQCRQCGYVEQAWKPPRYRRVLKYRWGTMIVDEYHSAKNVNTDQGRTVMSLKAKHRLGLTGTIMTNTPSDPYWPLHWNFGGGTYRFPYFRSGKDGLVQWNKDFTSTVEVTNPTGDLVKRRRVPYLWRPFKFWKMMAPFMIRRTYDDPLVQESLAEAGLHYPTVLSPKVILCDPDPKQASLLLGTMHIFEKTYKSLKEKTEKQGKVLQPHSVLATMTMMKIAATCPDHLNLSLKKRGIDGLCYDGVPGGGKMKHIRNLVWSKVQNGEKVFILSFYREMLKIMEQELDVFNPIRFDPAWDEETRYEQRMKFQDPNSGHQVFIAGINTVQVSVDLSAANTVICADLLWTPGLQAQAWSRILQPTPQPRTCEIYLMLLKHSIDRHIYNLFYSKMVAAEQALDRRVTTKKDKGLDIDWFVDTVLSDRPKISQYLIDIGEPEMNYVPMLEMLSFDDHED